MKPEADRRQRLDIRQLVRDERGKVSSARTGLWLIAVPLAVFVIAIDIGLALATKPALPNTVYGLLGTMFLCFAGWAAGKGFAKEWGSVGAVAGALTNAVRDPRLPAKDDDERHDA